MIREKSTIGKGTLLNRVLSFHEISGRNPNRNRVFTQVNESAGNIDETNPKRFIDWKDKAFVGASKQKLLQRAVANDASARLLYLDKFATLSGTTLLLGAPFSKSTPPLDR